MTRFLSAEGRPGIGRRDTPALVAPAPQRGGPFVGRRVVWLVKNEGFVSGQGLRSRISACRKRGRGGRSRACYPVVENTVRKTWPGAAEAF